MFVIILSDGTVRQAKIELVKNTDYKVFSKSRYFFNWSLEKDYRVYKLCQKDQTDILGLISLAFFDAEYRVEIRLLALSKENVGKNKLIRRIAGNLFAFAAKQSIIRYGQMAAISLIPKTELGQHYMDAYGFEQAGRSLFMEGARLFDILKRYDHE